MFSVGEIFLKEVSYVYQGCIYSIKNSKTVKYYYYIILCFQILKVFYSLNWMLNCCLIIIYYHYQCY